MCCAAGERLGRILPDARCIVLPRSGHSPLLERNFSLLRLLIRARVLPPSPFITATTEAETKSEASEAVEASADAQDSSEIANNSKQPAPPAVQSRSKRATVPPDA